MCAHVSLRSWRVFEKRSRRLLLLLFHPHDFLSSDVVRCTFSDLIFCGKQRRTNCGRWKITSQSCWRRPTSSDQEVDSLLRPSPVRIVVLIRNSSIAMQNTNTLQNLDATTHIVAVSSARSGTDADFTPTTRTSASPRHLVTSEPPLFTMKV